MCFHHFSDADVGPDYLLVGQWDAEELHRTSTHGRLVKAWPE